MIATRKHTLSISNHPHEPVTLVPERSLCIPLHVDGMTLNPVADVGARVECGETLATTADLLLRLPAPFAGTIEKLTTIHTVTHGRQPAVCIRPDANASKSSPAQSPPENAREQHSEAKSTLSDTIAGSPDLLDDEGLHLSTAARELVSLPVQQLIIRMFDSQPGNWSNDRLLQPGNEKQLDSAITAAIQLAEMVTASRVTIAVSHDAPTAALKFLRRRLASDDSTHKTSGITARVIAVSDHHPADVPHHLARTISRREAPADGTTRQAGLWIVPATTLSLLSERTVATTALPHVELLVGRLNDKAVWCRAPLGSLISDVIACCLPNEPTARIVAGGWLVGHEVVPDETVVDGSFTSLWIVPPEQPDESLDCTRCGACADRCPSGLLPALLLDSIERNSVRPRSHDRLQACIGCGMCSEVCPSRLPVAWSIINEQVAPMRVSATHDRRRSEAAHSSATGTMPSGDVPAHTANSSAPSLLQRPLITTSITTRSSLRWWWLAGSTAALAGLVFFGIAALQTVLLSIGAACVAESIRVRWKRGQSEAHYSRAGLTGLLLALTLPPTASILVPVIGGFTAIAAGVSLGGGAWRHLWHPALVGRVVVQMLFFADLSLNVGLATSPVLAPGHLIFGDLSNTAVVESNAYQGWSDTRLEPRTAHAIRTERPVQMLHRLAKPTDASRRTESPRTSDDRLLRLVRDELPPWEDTLLGTVPGDIGATSTIVLLLIGVMLVLTGTLPWQIPVGVMLGAAITAITAPIYMRDDAAAAWLPVVYHSGDHATGLIYLAYQLTAGQLLLGAVLLSGDPTSSPLTRTGCFWFGIGVGVITIFMRMFGAIDGAVWWAILIMNTLVPLLDRRFEPRVWGKRASLW